MVIVQMSQTGKILGRYKEFWLRGENPVVARGYSGSGETIRVDMLRKVVIIAIGGKIGKPFLLDFATLLEQKKAEDHPLHSPEAKFRTPGWVRFSTGIVKRRNQGRFWSPNVLRRDVVWTICLRLACLVSPSRERGG